MLRVLVMGAHSLLADAIASTLAQETILKVRWVPEHKPDMDF
jgi:hypothetical protein